MMIYWDHSMRRIVHCLSFSIEWWQASFVMLVNLLPNADFVDVGTVETAFFLFIGNGSSCFCFLKSLFTVFLGYWICPVFEGYFVRSLCRTWRISTYRFCWSPVANIRLDGFGPFFFIDALPLCLCGWRSPAECCEQELWSSGDWDQGFHWLVNGGCLYRLCYCFIGFTITQVKLMSETI